uniref:Uncharacterized protein n=1 Tax=Pseudo-nitzschia australis TaxID=44445 RepID=A0A7S4ASN7_9STRA
MSLLSNKHGMIVPPLPLVSIPIPIVLVALVLSALILSCFHVEWSCVDLWISLFDVAWSIAAFEILMLIGVSQADGCSSINIGARIIAIEYAATRNAAANGDSRQAI